jgi:hypothetical protein
VLGTTELRTGGGMTSDYLKCGSGATAEVDSFVTEALRICASVFTTSEYIHIGGDEAVTPAADYTVFIRMVEKKVRALGKKMLGWSEIGNSYNGQRIYQDPTTLVEMYYSGKPPGDIIAWCDFLFLDMCNKNGDLNCQTWAAFLSPQSVYSLNLTQGGPTVRGLIAPLWGELLHPFDTYNDRQMWPRLVSAAEVAWVPAGSNTSTAWTDYSNRLGNFGCRFDRMGMKWYTNDGLVSWKRCTANPVRSSVFDNYVPIKDWVDAVHAGRTPASMLNPAVEAGKMFDLRGRFLGMYSKTAINHSQRLRNGVCLIEVPGQNRVKKLEYQP